MFSFMSNRRGRGGALFLGVITSAIGAWLCLLAAMAVPAIAVAKQPSRADHGNNAHSLFPPHVYAQRRAAAANTPSGAASPNDLTYHGGPVMRNPTNYVIIWNPPGSSFSATYQQMIEQYFNDVSDTPYMTINSQWGDTSGLPVPNTNHFGGTWVDTTNAYPHAGSYADPLTKSDIQDEIDRAIAANPTWQAPGLSTMYFVYLGHNIIECKGGASDCFAGPGVPNSAAKYCAYHSYFGSGPRVFATMPYASDGSCYGSPSQYPNGVDADIVLSPTSHEMVEAYSDPQLDAWYNDATGNENGDNCAYQYGQVEPDGTNFVLWGHRYQIQLEWSNALPGGCIKRLGPASQPTLTGDLSYGMVPRGSTIVKDILIQNTAAGDLNLLNVRLAPGAPSAFSIDPSSPRWGTLESGESVVMKVNFSPSPSATTVGPLTTSLIIDTDEPGFETQSIAAGGLIGLPKASLSGSLNFGTTCSGSPVDLQIFVNNTGNAPLTISSVAIAGGSTPGLSVLSPPVLPQTIAVGASLAFTIRFTPSGTPGPITGSVVVTTDDPATPIQSIPVSGSVGAPVVTIGASALDFGGVATDNRTSPNSRDRMLTIGNTGTCALSLNSDVISGPNGADFTIIGAPVLPLTIPAGSTVTLTVRFNPSAPGPRSGTLTVGTSDPATPSRVVALTGLGLVPAVQTSADALVFPPTVILSQAPGYTGTTKNLTVRNTGQAELIVDTMGTSGAPFSAAGPTVPPARIAPSDSFGEPVKFGPTATGNFTGTFTVSDTNPEGPVSKSVSLCGEGVGRGIRVLAVDNKGNLIANVSKLHLQSHGTAQSVNLNVMNLPLVPVTTSCDPTEKRHFENQALPATDTLNQRSSYYNLDVTAGGKATSITFTLGVSEFKTLIVTIK